MSRGNVAAATLFPDSSPLKLLRHHYGIQRQDTGFEFPGNHGMDISIMVFFQSAALDIPRQPGVTRTVDLVNLSGRSLDSKVGGGRRRGADLGGTALGLMSRLPRVIARRIDHLRRPRTAETQRRCETKRESEFSNCFDHISTFFLGAFDEERHFVRGNPPARNRKYMTVHRLAPRRRWGTGRICRSVLKENPV